MITSLQHKKRYVVRAVRYDIDVELEPHQPCLADLISGADRFDSLADIAELMGDDAGACRFRAEASHRRQLAFALLDGDTATSG